MAQNHLPIQHPPKIPDGYAAKGYRMVWMSNYISPGSYVACVPAQIINFNCFYVNSLEHWTTLENFMSLFHTTYITEQFNSDCIPNDHCLTKGLYVAVRYKTPKYENGWEYHRALILQRTGRTNKIYKIFLIDFGDISYVKIGDIRYIKREFLDRFPAQAIECRMLLSSAYDKYAKNEDVWQPEIKDLFIRKINDGILGIEFVKTTGEKSHGKMCNRWAVSVNLVKEISEITLEHLERWVINKVHGIYIDSDSEQKNEEPPTEGVDTHENPPKCRDESLLREQPSKSEEDECSHESCNSDMKGILSVGTSNFLGEPKELMITNKLSDDNFIDNYESGDSMDCVD